MSASFALAAVPIGPAGRDPAPCWREAETGIAAAAASGAGLAVLPELFALPYIAGEAPAAWAHLAEDEDGPTSRRMSAAAQASGTAVLFGLALRAGDGAPLNAARLARPDGRVETVAVKIHLPPPGPGEPYGEAHHFAPGAPRIATFDVGPVRVATLICYDRRFPECWRAAAQAGADVVAVLVGGPAPGDPEGLFAAELQAGARSNAVYAVAASRYGTETVSGRPVRHDGETLAVGPDGGMIARMPRGGPRRLIVPIDPGRLAHARETNATARRLRLPLAS
ncbi:carbon-nitrogen hydrolase family protein [Starkeya koreensis]|uniref:Carbon-nitrogen hydrolase family protein n=1 Tax=Ancylobacter koreensis TaxID=266121 RepID=A0ABT0DID7_9HYPH|nr:carbon-nitrogen hydrolase family protein [Ancylobacter koreensis]MCK0207048.1 carbon-nitrogen hydrolase family protein [Ancylobacter koreensis]